MTRLCPWHNVYPRRMKTLLKVALGLTFSALTLLLFLRNLDFAKVRDGVAGASPPLLLLAMVIGLAFAWRDGLTPGNLRALAQESADREPRAETTAELRAEGGLAATPRAFKRRANGEAGR